MPCLGLGAHIFYANNSGLQFYRGLPYCFLSKGHSGKYLVDTKFCPLPDILVLYGMWYQKMWLRTDSENRVLRGIQVRCFEQSVLKPGWVVFLLPFCRQLGERAWSRFLGFDKTFLIYESGWKPVGLRVSKCHMDKATQLRKSQHLKPPAVLLGLIDHIQWLQQIEGKPRTNQNRSFMPFHVSDNRKHGEPLS